MLATEPATTSVLQSSPGETLSTAFLFCCIAFIQHCLPNPRHLLDLPLVLSAFLVLIPTPSCISLGAAKAHSWYPLSPLCSFAALQEGLPSFAKGSFQTHGDCTTHTHAHTYTTNSTLPPMLFSGICSRTTFLPLLETI